MTVEDDVGVDVIRRLRTIGVEYYITGSEALPRYGEPRQTADIDIVLDLDPGEFHRVERAFRSDYVVNQPIGSGDRKIASVVALTGLGKADLILGRRDPWAQRAMARREAWDHPRPGDVGPVVGGSRSRQARVVGGSLGTPASRLRELDPHERCYR